MESADKTSTTDDVSNIQTVDTDASWSDKGEVEQRRTRGADAAHVADGNAWDKHVLLPSRVSLVANLATHEECSDPGAAGKGVQGSDKSSGSTNSKDMSVQTSYGSRSHSSDMSSIREGMGGSVDGSSSIDSSRSVLLPTDEDFPSASGGVSSQDSNDD